MWNWADKKVKKLGWLDIQLIKLSVVAFVLFIVSLLPMSVIEKIIDHKSNNQGKPAIKWPLHNRQILLYRAIDPASHID